MSNEKIGIEVKYKIQKIYILDDLYNEIIKDMDNEIAKLNINKNNYSHIEEINLHLGEINNLSFYQKKDFCKDHKDFVKEIYLINKTVLYNNNYLLFITNSYKYEFYRLPFLSIMRTLYKRKATPTYATVFKKIVFTDLLNSKIPISIKSGTDNSIYWSPVEIKKPGWNNYEKKNFYLEISASENAVFLKEHFSESSQPGIKDLESKINKVMMNEKSEMDTQSYQIEEEIVNKLLHLKILLDKEVISQEEFNQKKQEWLNLL